MGVYAEYGLLVTGSGWEPGQRGCVAVVGAGPTGLMAAERLATAGYAVSVYDQMASPARKLLMAGRGGLNLTHTEPTPDFLRRYGAAAERLVPWLAAFSPADLRRWADGLGADTFVGTSGRVFPRAMKASPLLRAWLQRLDRLGVTLHTRHEWTGFDGERSLTFRTPAGPRTVSADATVLALGGGSWPRLGSTAAWVPFLRAAGIAVHDLKPANAGLKTSWSAHFAGHFAGAPLKRIAVTFEGATARGEAMITRDGLEGGAIYAVFPAVRDVLAAAAPVTLSIDLRPDLSRDALTAKLARPRGKQSIASFLKRTPQLAPVAIALLRETAAGNRALPTEPSELARLVKSVPVRISGTAGLARAISSAGGIALEALDDNLMLVGRPGAFACGEMLDWEAPTGGYLLQACLSSAVVAANGVEAWLRQQPAAHPLRHRRTE